MAHCFGYNESTIYHLQACFLQTGSEKDSPRSEGQQIMTPREDKFIVTSSRCNHFMATPKLVERLKHAPGTRISVYTAKNSLSFIQARGGHTRY